MKRVNIGCGLHPTKGWINYDNNVFIYFARIPLAKWILSRMPFIPEGIILFMEKVNTYGIKYANAAKRIPEPDNSIAVLYSSHMLEHLDNKEAIVFLREARRVLVKDGIIRIVIPDFDYFIEEYLKDHDPGKFIKNTCLVGSKPNKIVKKIQYLIMGHGWHHCMYNRITIADLLGNAGFTNIRIVNAGETTIKNADELALNEHEGISIYLEAQK